MIVDVTGFGWSGSGAVHDLLREYDDVQFASFDDFEFTLLYQVDGIADLEYKLCQKHCRYGDSDKAISRFLTLVKALEDTKGFKYNELFKGQFYNICEKYIKKLTQVEFEARNFDDVMSKGFREKRYIFERAIWSRLLCNRLIYPIMQKLFHRNLVNEIVKPNKHRIFLSYNPEKFLETTQEFMEDLLSFFQINNPKQLPLVTDQFFPPDGPEPYFKYVKEPAKCIVVKRDPRDLYLLAKFAYNSIFPIPTNTIDDFIVFYRKTIEETITPDTDKHITINFEELVYNYDETVKKIETFIGATSHCKKNQFFDPNKSINNTQLFNYYTDCKDDVAKIVSALPSSLFPFEKYQKLESGRHIVY